jgi:AmmeMemoRadiSam system protein A
MPSPPPDPSAEAAPTPPGQQGAPGEFSAAERVLLLQLAHEAIASALARRPTPLASPNRHLAENRGVFTTLYLDGELRGCVGYVFPAFPLYRAVFETARAAAAQDTRFAPVTLDEAPRLKISLSVLSAIEPITADRVEIGKHGLLVTLAGQRGLLLPQVPVEHDWDRLTFLQQTCRKAGLPNDAWQKGATLEAFTAEVFSDPGVPA